MRAEVEISKSNQQIILNENEDLKKVMNAVSSSIMTGLVLGGLCGFCYIFNGRLRGGSVILAFSIVYPKECLSESDMVTTLNNWFRDGQLIQSGDFSAEATLVNDTILCEY